MANSNSLPSINEGDDDDDLARAQLWVHSKLTIRICAKNIIEQHPHSAINLVLDNSPLESLRCRGGRAIANEQYIFDSMSSSNMVMAMAVSKLAS